MVAPGLAGLKTVLVLHDAKRIGSPNATWGIIEGNPVQDDIREIARTTGVTFSIDVTHESRSGKSRPSSPGNCSRARPGLRVFEAERDVPCRLTLRRRPHDELGISARSESVSGGQRHVGRGQGREERRRHRLRRECRDGLPNHGSYGEVLASRPTPAALLEMINAPGFASPTRGRCRCRRRF